MVSHLKASILLLQKTKEKEYYTSLINYSTSVHQQAYMYLLHLIGDVGKTQILERFKICLSVMRLEYLRYERVPSITDYGYYAHKNQNLAYTVPDMMTEMKTIDPNWI